MKFKLDENLGNRTRSLIQEAGFDVETVLSEQLVGSTMMHYLMFAKRKGDA